MRTRHLTLSLLVLLLLVAALLRLPALEATPPGLHYDEAANAILASEIGLEGERPIFIASYTGKEAAFFYLAGGLMALVGESVFALRLAAAFVGLLTIAAAYWLGLELTRDRRIALLAAALLAVSFWHLLFSRLGFRAITEPLLQAITAAALLRGLRLNNWRWLAAAGVALGLTAYTYLAARLFPVGLLLALLPVLANRARWRQRWGQLLTTTVLALLVLSPLLWYFINNPTAFWVRITQVAPGAEALTFSDSLLRSLGMIFLRGDPYIRFNLPLRPLFDWFWGALLLVGWLVCWWQLRRVREDWQRTSLLLLIVMPLVMLLPTALATSEIVPSNLRAIGLIPFVFYLPPIGLLLLLTDIERRWGQPQVLPMVLLAAALLAVNSGLTTARAYFDDWAQQPDLFYELDGDLGAVAGFLNNIEPGSRDIFVAALHYQHPTLAFLSEEYDRVKWLLGSAALVLPPEGGTLYFYPQNSPLPEWARPYLETATRFSSDIGPGPEPTFTVYELDQPPPITIPNEVNANFGYALTLRGYAVGTAVAGDTLPLLLFWRVDAPPPADLVPFVHLVDEWDYRWSQVDAAAYPAAQWQVGETIIQRVDVAVPPGTPADSYRLRLGMYDPASGNRLSRLDDNGRFAGDSFFIEEVAVAAGPSPDQLPQPPIGVGEVVRPGLSLLGYEPFPAELATGERLPLAFWWQLTTPQPDLTLRLELVPPGGPGIILANTRPVHGTQSFAGLAAPQFVIDRQALRVDDDILPGTYRLRLRLVDGGDAAVYATDLGELTITAAERLFDPPPMTYPQDATLGSEIKLIGYEVADTDDPNQYTLTLVWQALSPPSADYTVFAHLLRPDGSCCIWQQDVMPQQNQYPTSRWVAGEVVVDQYLMTVPAETAAGVYPIEVGLYIAETGQRLQVVVSGLPDSDVVLLRPLQRE